MDRINNKDTPQQLKAQLEGPQSSSALTASGEQLKDIFLECVYVRTKKSLEHLKLFVEKFYAEFFEPWFVKSEQGQLTMIKTTLRVWGAPRNSQRCLYILEKLWQMGIITGDAIVGYCLKQHSVIKEEHSLEFRLLKLISARVFGQREFLLTLFKQRGFLGSLVNQPSSSSMQIDEGNVVPRE